MTKVQLTTQGSWKTNEVVCLKSILKTVTGLGERSYVNSWYS